ncbi:MAG: helix-turn-helix domain-containing protein [Dysgonamonadaceae bacterium]|jgi:AraC-like DNA-binding protein|nr:helix-turn-helix domain-containing protein [Dysgonamonadaceae bacterium]
MNTKVTPLTWQTDVKNKVKSKSIGNDFIMFDDFSDIQVFAYPFKLDMLIFLVCEKGSARGTVAMQPYNLSAPFAVIVRPNQVMHYEYISPDFSGRCLIMSENFAVEFLPNIDKQMLFASAIQENPYAQLEAEDLKFVRHYFTILEKFVEMTDSPYRLEMVKHLTMVFYYWARPHFQVSPEAVKQPRQALLAEQFITLVHENYHSERDTAFYAEKLFLTPKYLSQAIKSATGKSASGWIDDYVILEARALLKSTNMTIQQISDALNFPSQSFFGKYFKRIAGVSPREYRRG